MSTTASARRCSTAMHLFRLLLLAIWTAASFGVAYFARDLQFLAAGWPVNYWMAAQGSVLVFIAIVIVYAVVMNRVDPSDAADEDHG